MMKKRFPARLWLPALLVLAVPVALVAYSHARIVQLSLTDGDVQVERPGNRGWERGLYSLPLPHDSVVATRDGVAEVEFEEVGYARLAQHTRLHLAELGLEDDGGRVTRVALEQGTATFDVKLAKHDSFLIQTPDFPVTVPERAVVRVDLSDTGARVRVFEGEVEIAAPTGPVTLNKGKMLEWDATRGEALLAANLEPDGWDRWNDERARDVRTQATLAARGAGSPYGSGYWNGYGYNAPCSGWFYDPYLGWWSPNWGTTYGYTPYGYTPYGLYGNAATNCDYPGSLFYWNSFAYGNRWPWWWGRGIGGGGSGGNGEGGNGNLPPPTPSSRPGPAPTPTRGGGPLPAPTPSVIPPPAPRPAVAPRPAPRPSVAPRPRPAPRPSVAPRPRPTPRVTPRPPSRPPARAPRPAPRPSTPPHN